MPGLEAHGGYTFCGTAALVILGNEQMLDLRALLVRELSRESPVFGAERTQVQSVCTHSNVVQTITELKLLSSSGETLVSHQ